LKEWSGSSYEQPWKRLLRLAVLVDVGEPRLAAVGARQPAQVVVERPVLHHQHDERVDRHVARARQLDLALLAPRFGDQRVGVEHRAEPGGQARRDRGSLQEVAALQVLVGRVGGEPLCALGIADIPHWWASLTGRRASCVYSV